MSKIWLLGLAMLALFIVVPLAKADCSTANYTLTSTSNQCLNVTNYRHNTTYYDLNNCNLTTTNTTNNYTFSNYTYPALNYNVYNATQYSCSGASTFNTTDIYHDNMTCGYSTSNSSFSTCMYGCSDNACVQTPSQWSPLLTKAVLGTVLGAGAILFILGNLVTTPTSPDDLIKIIVAIIVIIIVIGIALTAL